MPSQLQKFTNAAERIAAQANVPVGVEVMDADTGHTYRRTASGWVQSGVYGGSGSCIINPATGLPFGTMNGGLMVADMYHPARDFYMDFFFGADDALSAALTANVANNGLWLDQSYINPDTRSIVIVNGNASPSFSYLVQFSRNGIGSTSDDTYTAIASAPSTSQITQIPVPVAEGYDQFIRLVITPDAGQTGTQLQFKSYLTGRGG